MGGRESSESGGDWLVFEDWTLMLRIGQLEGYCKHGDEPSGSGATELVLLIIKLVGHIFTTRL
jgi:hypothetical protein